jgi:hypothetical protein
MRSSALRKNTENVCLNCYQGALQQPESYAVMLIPCNPLGGWISLGLLMPTDKPFFPNLRPVKKVVTPQGEILTRKECQCGREFMGRAKKAKRK